MKNSAMINKIAKAKRYAEEPERIQFKRFEATFRGDNDTHKINFENGKWHCSCRFFHDWGDCSHTMAMQRILGVTIPPEHRHSIPVTGTSKGIGNPDPEEVSRSTIQFQGIRITEDPLTAQNLAVVLTAISELYTQCWLIHKGRVDDLLDYSQSQDKRFPEEANLIISKVSYNSPFNLDWKLDASPQGVMIALATGIDAIIQAPQRLESATLENQSKKLTMELHELEIQSELADKEQARQITAQKAELEKELTLLEIEKQRLEVLDKSLEVGKKRIDYTIEAARSIVEILRPNADEQIKISFIQNLLPRLLKLYDGKGLELSILSIDYVDELITKDD